MDPHCRIGRIRMKAGGAEVRVFERPRSGLPDKLRRNVETLIGYFPDMAGFAIVCWGADASWSRATGDSGKSPITLTLMPSFVAEVLRRDVTDDVVCDRLDLP